MTGLIKILLIVGAIVVGLLALRYLFSHWYLATENANFAEHHKKSRLNCFERALHCAIRDNDKKRFEEELNKNADLEARDGWGRSPLFYSIKQINPRFVDQLLQAGTNANTKDERDIAALYQAVANKDLETVHNLLIYGANVNATNGELSVTALHSAIFDEDADTIRLLLKLGADARIKDDLGRSVIDKINLEKATKTN